MSPCNFFASVGRTLAVPSSKSEVGMFSSMLPWMTFMKWAGRPVGLSMVSLYV